MVFSFIAVGKMSVNYCLMRVTCYLHLFISFTIAFIAKYDTDVCYISSEKVTQINDCMQNNKLELIVINVG